MSKVKIQGNASGTGVLTIAAPNTSTDRTITLPDSTGTLVDDTTAVTKDASGNVGIGVTPESWNSGWNTLQIGDGASIAGRTASGNVDISSNAYRESTDNRWEYIGANGSEEAAKYTQFSGQHVFYTAPSGSADSAISWTTAMTIDNNGHVTMPSQPSIVLGGTTGGYATVNSGSVAPFNSIETQTGGSNYNTSTYRYTAPVAGWYQVTFHALSQSEIEQEWLLRKNANTIRRTFQPTDSVRCWSFSTQVYCAVNDYLDIESNTSNSNNIYMSSGGNMYSWVSYRLLG